MKGLRSLIALVAIVVLGVQADLPSTDADLPKCAVTAPIYTSSPVLNESPVSVHGRGHTFLGLRTHEHNMHLHK